KYYVDLWRPTKVSKCGGYVFVRRQFAPSETPQRENGEGIRIARRVRRGLFKRSVGLGFEGRQREPSQAVNVELRDSEVRDLWSAIIIEEDVARLEIAVHQTFC